MKSMTSRKDNALLVASFLIAIVIFIGAGSIIVPYVIKPLSSSPNSYSSVQDRISAGERVLVKKDENILDKPEFLKAKTEAVSAITSKKYVLAINQLESALRLYPNAPETVIYLNNVRISENSKVYTIAVSAPLDDQPNALAILRGVAQAQKEINESGGINGVPLKIIIADDDNDEEIAKQIAFALSQNKEVLGVIGHFSSGTTLAAKEIYDREQMPVISSTSSSVDLSQKDYVFRTVPSDASTARGLAEYMLKTLELKKVAVFFDSDSNYSRSLSSTFTREIEQGDGKIVSQFDFHKQDFNPSESVRQAIKSGAEVLMLAATDADFSSVYKVIQTNNKQLKLLGGDELYTIKMLKNDEIPSIGKLSEDMVVGAAWDPQVRPDPENQDLKFNARAEQLWGAKVNWFTAMSYDATKAFAEAIKREPSREGIHQALSDLNFSTPGAARPIQFTSEGDRIGKVYLFQIRTEDPLNPYRSRTGYDFRPVNP
jgi:branched-chain amino acid transport system substrate-binding protein